MTSGRPSGAAGWGSGRFDHSDRRFVAPGADRRRNRRIHLIGWVLHACAGLASIVLVGSTLGAGRVTTLLAQVATFGWSAVAFAAVSAPASARRLLRWPLLPRIAAEPSRSADLDELARNLFGQALIGATVPATVGICLLIDPSTPALVLLAAAVLGYVAMVASVAGEVRLRLIFDPPPALPVRVHFGDEALAGWALDHADFDGEWFTLIQWSDGRNWIRSARNHEPFMAAPAVWFEQAEVTDEHRMVAVEFGIELLPADRVEVVEKDQFGHPVDN